MQNSPLLVSQVAPVEKVDARPQQQQEEAGESFEQVLSKQVQKEQANAKVDENGQVTERAEDTENIALTGLLAEMPDEQPLGEAAVEASVDAQLLAKAATAKVVKEVTEGEVDIDAGLTANLAASIQPNQATLSTTSQSQVDVLASQKKAGLTVDTKLTVDARLDAKQAAELAEADIDAATDQVDLMTQQLQAKPLKESAETLQAKLANVLATDQKPQALAEPTVDNNIKAASDIAALSMQSVAAKPVATAEQTQALGASNTILASPGKTGWNEAINQKVMWMVGASEQSATLTLNPKDLGPLQVIIHVNNEKADATFISENPEVRKALEEGMSNLRNAMGQAGIDLGQANVNTSKEHEANQEQRAATQTPNGNDTHLSDSQANTPISVRESKGLVDTFA